MMSLLSAIANRKSQRHQDAARRYAAILDGNNDADADELVSLMETLGKTESNVAADLVILAGWDNHAARYATSDDASKNFKQARAELEKYQADLAAFKACGGYDPQRETAGLDKMHLRFNQAENTLHVACGARDHMVRMQSEHPKLLGGKVLPK